MNMIAGELKITIVSIGSMISKMHKTIRVTHHNMSADIDELIAPLIQAMWDVGIETVASCQGNEGIAEIYLNGVEHLRKFLEIVWIPEAEALKVATEAGEVPIGFPFWLKWKTWLAPQWQNGKVDYLVMIGFPYNEIENFIKRLKGKL